MIDNFSKSLVSTNSTTQPLFQRTKKGTQVRIFCGSRGSRTPDLLDVSQLLWTN